MKGKCNLIVTSRDAISSALRGSSKWLLGGAVVLSPYTPRSHEQREPMQANAPTLHGLEGYKCGRAFIVAIGLRTPFAFGAS